MLNLLLQTPRRIPPKTNNRAAVGGPRARVNRTVNDTPRSTDSKPPAGARRVIKGKGRTDKPFHLKQEFRYFKRDKYIGLLIIKTR